MSYCLIWPLIQQVIKILDCIRTNLLCKEVITFSKSLLKAEGILVSKLFMGQDFIEAKNLAKVILKS